MGGMGGFGRGHPFGGMHFRHTGQGEFSPEDIFNAFFQGGMGQGHPFRPQRAQRRAEEPGPQQEQRGGFAQLLQLLPIIVLVLMSFGGSGNSAQPSFSLHSTPPYVLPRRTPAPLMVNYYVSESFDRYYPLGTDAHRRLMREVEGEYRSRLAHQCNTEQAVRSRKINQARTMEARSSAKSLSLPACDEFQDKFGAGGGGSGRKAFAQGAASF